ncbi:hypothetical protein M885DRAFT_556306 [Pelagophyceae sp. CCMP2097]|nr:hypothetical protein M885DRAFT_556306 [Pelagophyceae sp. CCMP2097]
MSLLWLTAFALALLVLALRWAAMPLRAAAARRRASAGDQADRDAWFARGVSGRCYLSLIIPAYNERDRLPEMLRAAAKYLLTRRAADAKFTFEVLVVDDGSSDGTCVLDVDGLV